MQEKKLDTFIADVLALKLRFPIVTIAKRTDEDRGNVCRYVRGRNKPSKSFLIRFYKAFKDELAAIGIHRDINHLTDENPMLNAHVNEKDMSKEILDSLNRQLYLSQKILEQSARIEQKTNELLKWYKFGGQRWELN